MGPGRERRGDCTAWARGLIGCPAISAMAISHRGRGITQSETHSLSLSEQPPLCPTPSPGRALDSLTTHCRRSIILRLQIPALPFPPRPHPHPLPCLGKKGFLKPEWGAEPRSSLGGVSGPESPRRLDGETGRTGSAACVVPRPLGTRSHEEMC